MTTLESLRKKIKAIPIRMLDTIGVPDFEKNIFNNYKIFPIELLVKADWNYNTDDEFQSERLRNNLKKRGQIENIHVRELETGYYEVINGNHRLDELTLLAKSFVLAYDHGKISLSEAQRITIETNETDFKPDDNKLSAILNSLVLEYGEEDLKITIPFTDDEFSELLNLTIEPLDVELNEVDEDDFQEEPPEVPKTIAGDLYELNGHRLLCGDSTKENDIIKLMEGKTASLLFTDPPYNINYAEFNLKRSDTGKNWTDCSGWHDKMSDADYQLFLFDFLKLAKQSLGEWSHYYIWHASIYYRELLNALELNDIPYDKVPIQWVKQVATLSWVHYKRKSEPCIFAGKGAVNGMGDGARWFGPNNEINIWEINRDHNVNYIHPTQKPVALAARAINNSSQKDEIVLDMFLGSGSTLIAADELDRICFGMELEPKFCDVIVKRYIKYCEDKNKECVVMLNGKNINKSYFD